MIIKNFLNKLYISKYTYIIVFISLITGLIKELLIVTLLIIIHEFGHYLLSYIFKWNIYKIYIYPFGGLIKYEDIIDKPLYEELLITIAGPLFQFIIFFIFIIFKGYFSSYFIKSLYNYHIYMSIFNLLPIIPLDGSKIVNIILNKFLNYKLSNNILIIISILFLIGFIVIFKNNYSYYFIICFLLYKTIEFFKNRKYLFYRFVYEKYLYNNNYKKRRVINSISKMKRNKKHIFKCNNKLYTEKEFIKKGV